MQTKKTTRTARRTARSLALATFAVPAITLIGGATAAEALQRGRPVEAPAESVPATQGADVADSFAEALAAWQLEALSGEASTQALKELRVQVQRAVKEAPTDAALADVLVDVEAAWVARIAAAGEESERESALASLAAAVSIAGGEGEADPLTAARARAAERPGVAALLAARAEAKGANAPVTPAQSDVALSRAIETALASGDTAFINGLGSLAVEPLRQLALASNGSPRPTGAMSPLRALLDVDVRAGLDAAVTLVARKDLLLKREVAAAIQGSRAFEDDRAWTVRPGAPDEIGDPAWLEIVLKLTEEPSVSLSSVRSMLEDMLVRAALPPRHWDLAFAAGVRGGGGMWPHPSMSGYYERFLESDDPKTVEHGIRYFSAQEDASPLYSVVDSPIGHRYVGRSWMVFGPLEFVSWTPGVDHAERKRALPRIDARYVDAFRRALRAYPDEAIQLLQNAQRVTAEDPTRALPADLLLEAAAALRHSERRNDFAVFQYTVECEGDTERELATAAILDALDADVDLDVVISSLDIFASEKAEAATYWAVSEILDARLAPSRALDWSRLRTVSQVLYKDPSKLDETVETMASIAADPERAEVLAEASMGSRMGQVIASIAPERAPEILSRMASWRGVDVFDAVTGSRRSRFDSAAARAISVAVLESPTATPNNREHACKVVTNGNAVLEDTGAIERATVEVIARGDSTGASLFDLSRIGVDRPAVVAGLLDRGGVPDGALRNLNVSDLDEPLARRVLERFPAAEIEDDSGHRLVEGAVVTVVSSDAEDRVAVAEPYVQASPRIAERLMRAFAYDPDPETLHLIRFATERAELDQDGFERLAGAISGLMTDESAAILLDLGRRPDLAPEKRSAAMEQFETMLQWREAAARWERSSGAVAQRDGAIAKLVEMLDSDSSTTAQRVEAVRGLGLLGAAEELPRLIGLLGDDDLGAAAQGAIDALHAKGSGEGK